MWNLSIGGKIGRSFARHGIKKEGLIDWKDALMRWRDLFNFTVSFVKAKRFILIFLEGEVFYIWGVGVRLH